MILRMTWNAPIRLCLRAAAAAAWLLSAAGAYGIPCQTKGIHIIAGIDEARWITVHEHLDLFFSRPTSEFRLPLPERVNYRGQVLTYEYRAALAGVESAGRAPRASVAEESASGQWTVVVRSSKPMAGATKLDVSYSVRGGFLDRDPDRSTQIYWPAVPSWPSIADEVTLELSAPQTGLVGQRAICGFPNGAISTDVDVEHPTLNNPGVSLDLIGGNYTRCTLLRPLAEGEGVALVIWVSDERPRPDSLYSSSIFIGDPMFTSPAQSSVGAVFSWPFLCGMPILFGVIAGLRIRRRMTVRPWTRDRLVEDRNWLN